MPINPLQPFLEQDESFFNDDPPEREGPSRTYRLDFTEHRIRRFIDDEAALRQAIKKVLNTDRFIFKIYDGSYGCEVKQLVSAGVSDEVLNQEAARLIREALLRDDRIKDAHSFTFKKERDALMIDFTVVAFDDKEIKEEVTISAG